MAHGIPSSRRTTIGDHSDLTTRLIREGCEQPSPLPRHDVGAAWRRGMMHAVERLDLVVTPRRKITQRNAREVVEEVRAVLDELTEFQRHNMPATHAEAFDLCRDDYRRALEAMRKDRAA